MSLITSPTLPSKRFSIFKKLHRASRTRETETFIDHLEALRWHLFRAVVAWLIAMIGIFLSIDWIFDNLVYAPARPDFVTYTFLCNLSHQLNLGEALCMPPVEIPLMGNTVSGPFMSALSIAMMGGLIIAMPYLLWEIWRFINPALEHKEKKYARTGIFWVSICFFAGGAFGYFILAPFTFNFLANFTLGSTGAYRYMPSLSDYISSLTNLILGCGIAFQIPVVTYVLARIGLVTGDYMKKTRKYSFLIILILAAVITPSPDWTSQFIVAVPLLLLYELSIVIASKVNRQQKKLALAK